MGPPPACLPFGLGHVLRSLLQLAGSPLSRLSLVEGNVITIEPGVYVPVDYSYPKHFHGIGIRIEVSLVPSKEHHVARLKENDAWLS